MLDDAEMEPSFLPRIKETRRKKNQLHDKAVFELENLEEAITKNPYSDPEQHLTPIPNLIVENSTSYERSVVRGRKSTLEHVDR